MDTDNFKDFTHTNKSITCTYHGKGPLHLETAVLSEAGSELVVAVSLFQEDISSWLYDAGRHSLDIWYRPLPEGEMRIAILPFAEFGVPKDIREINIYDIGQEQKGE